MFLFKQKESRRQKLTTAVLVPMKILKNDDDNVLYVVGVVAKEAVGDKELAVEGVSVICPLVNWLWVWEVAVGAPVVFIMASFMSPNDRLLLWDKFDVDAWPLTLPGL